MERVISPNKLSVTIAEDGTFFIVFDVVGPKIQEDGSTNGTILLDRVYVQLVSAAAKGMADIITTLREQQADKIGPKPQNVSVNGQPIQLK